MTIRIDWTDKEIPCLFQNSSPVEKVIWATLFLLDGGDGVDEELASEASTKIAELLVMMGVIEREQFIQENLRIEASYLIETFQGVDSELEGMEVVEVEDDST